jgi:23S rRNA-/tRNA-specific pseudouridylate synthase
MGEVPLRLPVLAECDGWIALNKSAGLAVRDYPWDGKRPSLDAALNQQLQAAKPELVRRGATMFGSVYYLDPEISGVTVFGKSRDALAELRNRFGSGECDFRFIFVTGPTPAELEAGFTADAPLMPHNVKPKMIPSSAKGKKSFTEFKRLAESEHGWTLWEAKVAFFRPHHVRAHAAVHGLPILGDQLYDGPEAPTRRDLMPRKKGGGLHASAFDGLALHLASCEIGEGGIIHAPLPNSFRLFLGRLGIEDPLD